MTGPESRFDREAHADVVTASVDVNPDSEQHRFADSRQGKRLAHVSGRTEVIGGARRRDPLLVHAVVERTSQHGTADRALE